MPPRRDPYSPQILLVEDDASLSRCLNQFLEDHGYRTVLAGTLRAGFELLQQYRPRLCLLDLNLPDGSGLELLKAIAASGRPCKVIVMTAFDLMHLRPETAAGVRVGWMTKPVDPLRLLELVEAEEMGPCDTIPDAGRTCSCG